MVEELKKVLYGVFEELEINDYLIVSESNKKELCDYQINTLFKIAKEKNTNLNDLGSTIVEKVRNLPNFLDYFESVDFLNGFINIKISNKFINKWLNYVSENNYGITKVTSEETYFLDYGGPNIAKPLHIGHLRSAIIGESLKRILKYKGYKVISDVHFGDFGLQMGYVIYGIITDNKELEEVDIDYLNEVYPRISELAKTDEKVYNESKLIVKQLQNGNEYYNNIWKKIYEVSINDIKKLYSYLDVDFDLWLGESDARPYIKDLIKLLEEKDLIVEDDNARIVPLKEETDNKEMPPLIVEKSDGSFIYATTDLATIYDRINKYNPNYILYVVDARQSLHFEQVFRTCKKLGWNNKFEHIPFGTINGSDGKPFKTRSGGVLKLEDLIQMTKETFINKREENINMSESDLNKIINSIIKYADLQNNREKNYIFDISKFSDIQGKTGPYILYSTIRIKKILDLNSYDKKQLSNNIYDEIDRKLRIKLLEFNKYIEKAIELRLPSVIAEYLYDLSDIASSFYQNNNINKETNLEKKNDWLVLLDLTYNILKEALNLLVIDLPSKM